MKFDVLNDESGVAREAAAIIAEEARTVSRARGRFVIALSGGKTPWLMLRALANEEVPWDAVHVVQVDERVAPDGNPDRNLTHLRESLLAQLVFFQLPEILQIQPDLKTNRPVVILSADRVAERLSLRVTLNTYVRRLNHVQPGRVRDI